MKRDIDDTVGIHNVTDRQSNLSWQDRPLLQHYFVCTSVLLYTEGSGVNSFFIFIISYWYIFIFYIDILCISISGFYCSVFSHKQLKPSAQRLCFLPSHTQTTSLIPHVGWLQGHNYCWRQTFAVFKKTVHHLPLMCSGWWDKWVFILHCNTRGRPKGSIACSKIPSVLHAHAFARPNE